MAGLSGALSGLAASYPGYLQGRENENTADMSDLKLDDAKRQALAIVSLGKGLAVLGGQGGGGMPPPGMVAAAPVPGQPSMAGGPQKGPPQGQPPQPQPQGPGRPPPGQPGAFPVRNFTEMYGTPMGMGGGAPAPGGASPQGGAPGGPAPSPGGAPGGPQQMPQQQGALDLRSVIEAIKRSNPGIAPDVLAEAVNHALPMLNAQSQQEWRMISLQMREQALQQREQQSAQSLRLRQEQIDNQFINGKGGKFSGDGMRAFAEGRVPSQAEHPFGKGARELLLEQWVYEEYPRTHDGKYPSFDEIIDERQKLTPKTATQLKQEQAGRVGNSIKMQLESALSDVVGADRGGTNPTGLIGMLNRLKETGLQVARLSDADTAKQFQTKLAFLRPQLMRYLTNTARVSNKELEESDAALRGLSAGSTIPSTLKSLDYAIRIVQTYMGEDPTGARNNTSGAQQPKQPDVKDKGYVDDFMKRAKEQGYTDEQIKEFLGSKNQAGRPAQRRDSGRAPQRSFRGGPPDASEELDPDPDWRRGVPQDFARFSDYLDTYFNKRGAAFGVYPYAKRSKADPERKDFLTDTPGAEIEDRRREPPYVRPPEDDEDEDNYVPEFSEKEATWLWKYKTRSTEEMLRKDQKGMAAEAGYNDIDIATRDRTSAFEQLKRDPKWEPPGWLPPLPANLRKELEEARAAKAKGPRKDKGTRGSSVAPANPGRKKRRGVGQDDAG